MEVLEHKEIMAKPSDKEYKLFRKIRELEEQNEKLKKEIVILEKKLEKDAVKVVKVKEVTKHQGGCPTCQAPIKITDLPFGKLKICTKGCGWRKVDNNV